jgi:hypothetical protein
MMLRNVHRGSALVLGAFVLLHLANHVAGFVGQDMHRMVQQALRPLYRGPAEVVLLAACGVQIATGLRLVWARRRMRGQPRLQALSGLALAIFLSVHLTAVLAARAVGIETDLAFAAAGLHAGGIWPFFFAPYYFVAVLAVAVHLSVPLGRHGLAASRGLVVAGAVLAAGLVALLGGLIVPLAIPAQTAAMFGG